MQRHTLQRRFESPAALRAEFEKNISNRGMFVATEAALEVRQTVAVEIVLAWRDATAEPVRLQGEIVHRVSPEMVRGLATPGVAIQFEESVGALRALFEPLLGDEPLPDPEVDRAGEGRRSARREPVRVPVRITMANGKAFEVTTRDLSGSGVLVSIREHRLVVGDSLRIALRHPVTGQAVELAGRVVREVANKQGEVAAVAIGFERKDVAQDSIRQTLDALRQASHQGRLGGISGSVVDLGLANLLQMLGSSAPQGTVVLERDGEQGFIAFADNLFVAAELGALSGHEAIVEMLGWTDGRFEFEARVDPVLIERSGNAPLAAVVLEAVCARDERARDAAAPRTGSKARPAAPPRLRPGEATFERPAVPPDATFAVDEARAEEAWDSLEKTEQAVLDLARAGMSGSRIEGVIPEPGERVREAIVTLLELGVLVPR